jgi:uncharacterized protein
MRAQARIGGCPERDAEVAVTAPTARDARAVVRATVLALAVLLAGLTGAIGAPTLPALTGRVVDGATLLAAADRAALEAQLAAFEARSTDQIVVVTVPSLQGYPIEAFAHALGTAWKIGQRGTDNGVIVLIAPTERQVRIEVGRGLEPLLPDGTAGTIVRTTLLPAFRRGDVAGGIREAVRAIDAVLTGDAAELAARAKRPPPPVDLSGYIVLAIWLVIVLLVIYAQVEAARRRSPLPLDHHGRPVGGRRRRSRAADWPDIVFVPGGSGTWGGRGSGAGGFSGGGGSFGGGGASGDW